MCGFTSNIKFGKILDGLSLRFRWIVLRSENNLYENNLILLNDITEDEESFMTPIIL